MTKPDTKETGDVYDAYTLDPGRLSRSKMTPVVKESFNDDAVHAKRLH